MGVTSEPHVVLAEDDEDFLVIARNALQESGFTGRLETVRSFDELKDYLRRGDSPSLIILDLKTPPLDWRRALRCLKGHKHYRSIPLVVLTTSSDEEDIELCAGYSGCSYIQKPMTFEAWKGRMEEVIRTNIESQDKDVKNGEEISCDRT